MDSAARRIKRTLSHVGITPQKTSAASEAAARANAEDAARQAKVEELSVSLPVVVILQDFSRLDALLFTAMGWILIPAYCSANS